MPAAPVVGEGAGAAARTNRHDERWGDIRAGRLRGRAVARPGVVRRRRMARPWRDMGHHPRMGVQGSVSGTDPDGALLAGLRAGDEGAVVALVERYQRPLQRFARLRVADDAAAEDVVQETWLAVLAGLDRFEGRSAFRTWLFRIAENRAITRGRRDSRTVPLGRLMSDAADDEGHAPTVDPERFLAEGRWAGHWSAPPAAWAPDAAERLLAAETRTVVAAAIAELPPAQQVVVTLRDVEGWSSDEVCAALEISPGNQRVLLHRARARLRVVLDRRLAAPA
jgi:RNA polymerase sigma-70 factor (ECF subfamily)